MSNSKYVWWLSTLLTMTHGTGASGEARRRAVEANDSGDRAAADIWLSVEKALDQLLTAGQGRELH